MIVWSEKHKQVLDVPDEMSDDQLVELVNSGEAPPPVVSEQQVREEQYGSISKWEPNFIEGTIKPWLQRQFPPSPDVPLRERQFAEFQQRNPNGTREAFLAERGGQFELNPKEVGTAGAAAVGSAIPTVRIGPDQVDAAMATMFNGLTFGIVGTKQYEEQIANHPIAAVAGQLTGELGSLMISGGIMAEAKLPIYANLVANQATKLPGIVGEKAMRFVPPMINYAGTFGTKKFIVEAVKAFQEGGADPVELGARVLKEAGVGGGLGVISGLAKAQVAIPSAATLGYFYSRSEGAGHVQAVTTGLLWAAFEAVGAIGKNQAQIQAAMDELVKVSGDYIKNLKPEYSEFAAQRVARSIWQKITGKGVVVKDQFDALTKIEKMNQAIRKSIIPRLPEGAKAIPEGLPPEVQPVSVEIKGQEAVNPPAPLVPGTEVAVPGTQAPLAIPEFKNTDEAVAYGKTIVGNQEAIDALKARRAELDVEKKALVGKEKAQARMDISFKQQFLREAYETAETPAPQAPVVAAPKKTIFTVQDLKSAISRETAQKLFHTEDPNDSTEHIILKAVRDKINEGEAGFRAPVGEEGTFVGFGSTFPKWFKDRGVSKDWATTQIQRVIDGKPITDKNRAMLAEFADAAIEEAQKEADYYEQKEAELNEREAERDEERRAIQSVEGKPSGTAASEADITFDPEALEQRVDAESAKTGPAALESSAARTIDDFEPGPTVTAPKDFKLFAEVKKLAEKYVPNWGETWHPKGTLGVMYTGTKNIFFTALNNISTVVHETLHNLDAKHGLYQRILAQTQALTGAKQKMVYDPTTSVEREQLSKIYVQYYGGARADHPMQKRVVEGLAVFHQRMLEAPEQTKKEYPELFDMMLKPGGKYFYQEMLDLHNDARKIVNEYQQLSDDAKIDARIYEEENKLREKNFLSPWDRVVTETLDQVRPFEKIAEKAGVAGTQNDPSLWLRMYPNIQTLVNRNINTDRGYFGLGPNGEFVKLHDFNWHTIAKQLHDRGMIGKFNGFLVARDTKFNYDRLEEMSRRMAEIKSEAAQIVNDIKNNDSYDSEEEMEKAIIAATKPLIAELKELQVQSAKLNAVLERSGISKKIATNAYNARKDDFVKETEMFDKLTDEDIKLLGHPSVQIIKPNTMNELLNREGYAPMKRMLFNEVRGETDADISGRPTGKKPSSLKQRKGSDRAIISPLASAIRNHAEIFRKSMRQIVINKFSTAVGNNFPSLFQEVPVVRVSQPDGTILYPQDKDPETIMFYRNYKRRAMKGNVEIINMLHDLITPESMSVLENAMVAANRLFTRGTTSLYIPFAINNIAIDQLSAFAQTSNNYIPIIDAVKTLRKALQDHSSKEAQYFREYIDLGGERQTFSGWLEKDPNEFIAQLAHERTGLQKAMDFLERGGQILQLPVQYSEIMTRGTEFVKARMAGKSQLQALEEAGRVTAPFHHIGRFGGKKVGGRVVKSAVRSIPYFNAQLQVLAQFGRTMNTEKGRERALLAMAIIATAMMSGYLLNRGMGSEQQKRLHESINPKELSQYVFFPSPIDPNKLWRIRIPENYAAPATMLNMIVANLAFDARYTGGEFVDAATSWIPDQLNVLDPQRLMLSWIPQFVKPAIEVALNKRTYPKVMPIESESDLRLEAFLRTRPNTSAFAKFIGKELGLSPLKVDYLIQGYFGRTSRFATGGDIKNPFEREWYFTSGRRMLEFWDAKVKVDQAYASRKYREFSPEEQKQVLDAKRQIAPLENALEKYRALERFDKKDPRLAEMRTQILDRLDSFDVELSLIGKKRVKIERKAPK